MGKGEEEEEEVVIWKSRGHRDNEASEYGKKGELMTETRTKCTHCAPTLTYYNKDSCVITQGAL